MKIALIGATGNAGSRILTELVSRGHAVTAIARDASRVPVEKGVTARSADANDAGALADVLAGHDAVISSAMFMTADPARLIEAVIRSGVKRYFVVGGAGTLEVAPGVRVIDSPDIPAEYQPEMRGGERMLNALRETALDWTFLSPGLEFAPGERTGAFRLGGDQLLMDGEGRSRISMEDYAIAVVDEIETPRHVKARFTIGY
jgi:putative NADH-flavin reductase